MEIRVRALAEDADVTPLTWLAFSGSILWLVSTAEGGRLARPRVCLFGERGLSVFFLSRDAAAAGGGAQALPSNCNAGAAAQLAFELRGRSRPRWPRSTQTAAALW